MAVVVPRIVFFHIMVEITPEHTATEALSVIRHILREFGLDNIPEHDILRTINEMVSLSDLSPGQRLRFYH